MSKYCHSLIKPLKVEQAIQQRTCRYINYLRVSSQQERLIADYEAKIAVKEKDIESIQEEIAKQAENSDVHARGHSTVR